MFDDIRSRDAKFYDFHSDAAKDLLSKLLIKDPNYRLSDPNVIMSHEFFKGTNFD